MRVLVTGGSGFIGTHVCRLLVGIGCDVKVIDLRAPAKPVFGVKYVIGDIRDVELMRREIASMEAVIHLAAMVSVTVCENNPADSYSHNVTGTASVVEAVLVEQERTSKPIRFVFSSSAAVYGNRADRISPISEACPKEFPCSLYGAQKLAAEEMLDILARNRGLEAVCLRYFNVFGPGQDPKSPYSGVISIFLDRVMSGENLMVYGTGCQSRDFVFVEDVARANVLSLKLQVPKFPVILNVGTGISTTIQSLAQLVVEAVGSDASIENGPARQGDIMHSVADNRLAEDLLGWVPKTDLKAGIHLLLNVVGDSRSGRSDVASEALWDSSHFEVSIRP